MFDDHILDLAFRVRIGLKTEVAHVRLKPILRPDQVCVAKPLSDFAAAGELRQISIRLRQKPEQLAIRLKVGFEIRRHSLRDIERGAILGVDIVKMLPLLEVVVLVEVHALLRVRTNVDRAVRDLLLALVLIRLQHAVFFVDLQLLLD